MYLILNYIILYQICFLSSKIILYFWLPMDTPKYFVSKPNQYFILLVCYSVMRFIYLCLIMWFRQSPIGRFSFVAAGFKFSLFICRKHCGSEKLVGQTKSTVWQSKNKSVGAAERVSTARRHQVVLFIMRRIQVDLVVQSRRYLTLKYGSWLSIFFLTWKIMQNFILISILVYTWIMILMIQIWLICTFFNFIINT
jgi:hypothetical protein